MPELVYKKSDQLSDKEKQQYCQLFHDVFHKTKSIKNFDRQFLNNYKGYGYHLLYICDKKIVGAYSVVPVEYTINDTPFSVGLVVDTMIREDYRNDFFMIKKMNKKLCPEMLADGIQFILGFPNKKIFKYRLRMLKWTAIADLSFYVLPINPKVFFPFFSFINPFLRLGRKIAVSIMKASASKRIYEHPIRKVINDKFLEFRYDKNYKTIDCGDDCKATYIIYKEAHKNIAYLVDFYPLSKKNFYLAMCKTAKHAGKGIDGVIYVGKLPFSSSLKLPAFKELQKVHMTACILDNNLNNSIVFDIKNWQVNFSDFDVR